MVKRGVAFLGIFILLFSLTTVLATHELSHVDEGTNDNDDFPSDDELEGDLDDESELDDEIDNEEETEDDFIDDFDDITDEEVEEELGDGGSVNGFDRFFDSIFQDDIENMRERFAEIRTLIRNGETDKARDLLEHYKDVAANLEKEVSPDQRDEVVKLTRIIRREIKAMENIIDDDLSDFEDVSDQAKNVGAAAEIASKIHDLCRQLHKLAVEDGDPDAWSQFGEVCKTNNDGPKWQKDLFDDLTQEQEEEVKKFVKIISQCMRTSGEECDCAGIPHDGMVAMCFEAAPLARECKLIDEGELDSEDEKFDGPNGDACDQLDKLDFPELPPHLERALEEVEREFGDASYDNHIPGPCRDAGIDGRGNDDREKCFAIMVEIEAPPECRDAIKEAGVNNERDARRICEEIMFEQHAPQECIDEGITNPRDCAEFFGEEFGPRDDFDRRGPDRGPDCRQIEDSGERLKCYDNTGKHFDNRFEDRGGPDRGPRGGWPEPCRKADAFTRESCEQIMRAEGDKRFEDTRREENQCREKCESQGKAWDFSFGCRCFEGDFRDDRRRDFDDRDRFRDDDEDDFDNHNDFDGGEEFDDKADQDFEEEFDDNFQNDFDQDDFQQSPPEDNSDTESDNSGSSNGEDNSGSGNNEEQEQPTSYITGNAFLDYYFR